MEALAPYFENRLGWENPVNEYVYRVYLLPAIFKFLYYDEYMMLPSRVSVNRLTQSRELERYKSELELIRAEFTEDFLKYWSNGSELGIEFELTGKKARYTGPGDFSLDAGKAEQGRTGGLSGDQGSEPEKIVFTSHSPYMLEYAEDVYCITSREGGSVIRALEEETDEETLMPLRGVFCIGSVRKT